MVVLSSFSAPTVGVRHVQPSTTLYVRGREVGVGTLYISESNVAWRNDSSGEGLTLSYPTIAVHGISRDVEQLGAECLYVMVDSCLEETNSDDEENGDGDDADSGGTTEMRFAPADKAQLDYMYRAMSYCQALHPDPNDSPQSEEEDDDEEGIFTKWCTKITMSNMRMQKMRERIYFAGGDGPYIEGHHDEGPSNGARLGEEEMEMDGQFEDAEDD
ncbi:methylosome subunit pICln [Homalodisca vitripennis]|uniref:methylosome subunit pICln n=1 Tax=Homalodisca vitripennis TaxID=197043 RepID=UPI001EEC5CC0|nr:methylosome subunit pICln [Homalodisca vitripennis]